MDGAYQNRLNSEIDLLIAEALQQQDIFDPVSKHIDRIHQNKIQKNDWIKLSIDAFDTLVRRIKGNELMPSLCIPLRSSETLEINPPSQSLLRLELSATPPELYLFHREIFKLLWKTESYSVPCDIFDEYRGKEEFYVYYKCSRSVNEFENNDEYGRVICIDYYPADFSAKTKQHD